MKYWTLILFILLPFFAAEGQAVNLVDLTWEASTYTPNWYLGAALATPGSEVRVVALPKNSSWIYEWQKDGYNIGSAGGSGANVLIFEAGKDGFQHEIRLRVKKGEEKLADQRLVVPIAKPEVHIYEYGQNSGLPNHNQSLIGQVNVLGREVPLLAEPFFFSLSELFDRQLKFDWQIGGNRAVGETEDNRRLKLVVPDGPQGDGTAKIFLKISNNRKVMQTAETSFLAQFGSSNNILGF